MNGTCPKLEKNVTLKLWKIRKFTLRIVYSLSRTEWIIFEIYFTNDHMEMATWGKTYWTFQESSELRGDVVREREKRRAEKDIHGRKRSETERRREKTKLSLKKPPCRSVEYIKNHRILTFESQEEYLLISEQLTQGCCDGFEGLLVSVSVWHLWAESSRPARQEWCSLIFIATLRTKCETPCQ